MPGPGSVYQHYKGAEEPTGLFCVSNAVVAMALLF